MCGHIRYLSDFNWYQVPNWVIHLIFSKVNLVPGTKFVSLILFFIQKRYEINMKSETFVKGACNVTDYMEKIKLTSDYTIFYTEL